MKEILNTVDPISRLFFFNPPNAKKHRTSLDLIPHLTQDSSIPDGRTEGGGGGSITSQD